MPEEKKATILLIEDDPTLVEMYSMKFKESGYSVVTSMKGAEGLEIAKKGEFDILLLDIILPEIDGFAILETLRKNEPTKKKPIIMLSNLGQDTDLEKGKKLGATDYFVKADFTPTEILKKVEEVLKK